MDLERAVRRRHVHRGEAHSDVLAGKKLKIITLKIITLNSSKIVEYSVIQLN